MKTAKILTALLLILMLTLPLFGCAKDTNTSVEPTQGIFEIKELVETLAPEKGSIEEYFARCSELSVESGKEIRVSSDVWQQEDIGENQVIYSSLGGSVVNSVLYDKENKKVLSVSSSLDIENYADEEMRASQIYNASVLAAAMINGDAQTVSDTVSEFESVIESGIEMYPENLKLSLSADEISVTLIAESTVIDD